MHTADPQTTTPLHAHHWLIREANGPLSRGICRECHQEREFRNWLPELDIITRSERALA